MTSTTPKTTAQAGTIIATLQIKREGLVETIAGFAERRREFAVAAELGDDDAAAELQKIEAGEVRARSSLQTLDFALHEVALLRDKLSARETVISDSRHVAELAATVEQLLELSDECDDALDHARDLLAKREEFKREKALILRRAAAGKMFGASLGREGETTAALESYFGGYLNAGKSYGIRIADGDSKYYGRQSPRQIERGPRILTAFEAAMKRDIVSRSAAPIEVAPIPRQVARRR